MKKVVAFILALVLTLSLFGCDTNSTTSSENSFMSSSADLSSSVENDVIPVVDELNEIYNSTKALAFSHYNGGKVQDWFFKESDIQSVIEILKDLEITSVREYNEEIDHKRIGDFVLYFSKTNEENHSTASKIYFGKQTVLNLNGLEYVVETTNANDIVNRLTTVIDNLIYENFLKIDGEIKSSNEVLNDILKRTKFIEYSCYDIGEAGGDTKDENLFVLLNVLSDFEITNMREYNKDTDEYYTGDFIVYLSENTENTSSHFVQINISSQIILFPDQTGYVFESPNIKDIDDRLYHEFQRIILRRMMQEMNGKL
jgi:archaellum component FlaG (FlaF/FlaG flagellin family)